MVCYINLESRPDGTVQFNAVYPDGFTVTDGAHQLAHMLTEYADSICVKSHEVVDSSPGSVVGKSPLIIS